MFYIRKTVSYDRSNVFDRGSSAFVSEIFRKCDVRDEALDIKSAFNLSREPRVVFSVTVLIQKSKILFEIIFFVRVSR